MAVNLFILPFGYLTYKNNNYGYLVVKVRVIFVLIKKSLFKMMNGIFYPTTLKLYSGQFRHCQCIIAFRFQHVVECIIIIRYFKQII